MECINHPTVQAQGRCAGCAEPFCANCLVPVQGSSYCAKCKVMAVSKQPVIEGRRKPCELAGESLKYGIIGLFCFGIILGPMAISKGLKAKKLIAKDPNLDGEGKATAGVILGIIATVIWVLSIAVRVAHAGK